MHICQQLPHFLHTLLHCPVLVPPFLHEPVTITKARIRFTTTMIGGGLTRIAIAAIGSRGRQASFGLRLKEGRLSLKPRETAPIGVQHSRARASVRCAPAGASGTCLEAWRAKSARRVRTKKRTFQGRCAGSSLQVRGSSWHGGRTFWGRGWPQAAVDASVPVRAGVQVSSELAHDRGPACKVEVCGDRWHGGRTCWGRVGQEQTAITTSEPVRGGVHIMSELAQDRRSAIHAPSDCTTMPWAGCFCRCTLRLTIPA
jgi:hypothetical protein